MKTSRTMAAKSCNLPSMNNRESPSPAPAVFRRKLLRWYEKAGRHGLPWRNGWSAYHVLVSELMLQQTTVAAVIPYFHRFLKSFPTFKALAAAPLEKVLEHWSGLGYYARARNLQAAAQKIVRDFGGRMPATREEVLSLPGVGPYTAGAILSFAYDKPEALVDGNVIRVISRIHGITENTKAPKILQKIWGVARALVPPEGARHFNSALMDFGATLCRPAAPDCLICPLAADCWARKNGRQNDIPRAEADKPRKKIFVHAALMERDGKVALVRRPDTGLYAGLWEFPGAITPRKSFSINDARKIFEEKWGAPAAGMVRLPAVRHVLSHREMTVAPWVFQTRSKDPPVRWFSWKEADGLAVSSLTRKILRLWRTAREKSVAVARAEALF